MKVIFLQDVPSVAQAGDIKEVADGYGRNFLIPKKLALLVNSPATNSIKQYLKIKVDNQRQIEAEAIKLAEQLEGKEITLKARVGSQNRLHGSITTTDIATELKESTGLAVDKRKIDLDEPIHKLGNYEITLRLAKDITPRIKVAVEQGTTE
jgi:large subunit ribosomal protein L9